MKRTGRVRCQPRRSGRNGLPGAATVEFALIAPLFLLLLAGIIEFGQAFRIEHSLANAARRGARAAIVENASSDQVKNKVEAHCTELLGVNQSDIDVAISVNGQAGAEVKGSATGAEVKVTVSIPYAKAGVGFYANLFAKKTLSSSCTLERE